MLKTFHWCSNSVRIKVVTMITLPLGSLICLWLHFLLLPFHPIQATLPTLSFLEYTKHVFISWCQVPSPRNTLLSNIFLAYSSYLHKIQNWRILEGSTPRCLKIFILFEPSSFLLRIILKEITHIHAKIYRQRYISSVIYLWILSRQKKYKCQPYGLL